MSTANLDRVRQSVLDSAEQSHRNFRWIILGFAALELAGWVAYIALAIYGFSLPVLIGVAAVCVYSINMAGTLGLKSQMDHSTQRVLKGIEMLAERSGVKEEEM